MAKTVKMCIFGKPGEGKSTFASKAPNPLFICTDGNFEWLGLPDQNHVRVSTWKQAKEVINNIVLAKPEYKDFQTIVVDLVEDLYVWAEDEFCKREGIIHVSDYKSMGAGYSVVRKEFFAQISKLLSIDKNVILISHEADKPGKTKAGADTYTYIPSDKMSLTKQWNDIEGQTRYFLRCFSQDEEVEGRVRKKRYLSLIPGQGEYGICRGADEENWPRECELDWDVFTSIIGVSNPTPLKVKAAPVVEETPVEDKPKPEPVKRVRKVNLKPASTTPDPKPEAEVETKTDTPDEDTTSDVPRIKAKLVKKEDDTEYYEADATEVLNQNKSEEEPKFEGENVSEPVKQNIDTSKLSVQEKRKLVLERMQAMKNRNK